MKLRIALDGPAGSGKTTVARLLARKLGVEAVDTGSTYRAVTYHLVENGVDLDDEVGIKQVLKNIKLKLKDGRVFVNGVDVSEKIRSEKISRLTNIVASYSFVRKFLRKLQRKLAKNGCVMEGRDIGTVVLKDAEYKFYLDADPYERALRRYKELKSKGKKVSFKKILEGIVRRDHLDKTRGISPLKIADDAVVIDTTGLSPAGVVKKILRHIKI